MVLALACVLPGGTQAQTADAGPRLRIGAHVIGMVTRLDPGIGGRVETETYLTQPMITGHGSLLDGLLTVSGTLNLEGLTMPGGELAPGNAGEGFVDRRHPHTYLHELMATFSPRVTGVAFSLSAGRGFAPFGTDDPMVRPFVRYPANHHWSQILERWTVIAAARGGPLTLEAGLFNGSEPDGPGDMGDFGSVGDSWSTRATLRPLDGLELQGSHAYVESPEDGTGFGLDHRQWSASARMDRALSPGSSIYLLLEVAETREYAEGRKRFTFTSVLGEMAWRTVPWAAALRFERTTRPEEERLFDPYRTPRPHSDQHVLGVTRWNSVTLHAARPLSSGSLALEPFAEVTRNSVEEITGAIFDPQAFYGATSIWSVSFGLRVRAGMQHDRMGRYGAALPAGTHAVHDHRTTDGE